MDWFAASVGDPAATRVLLHDVRQQVRRAKLAARLARDAQVYVITEADSVRFLFNASALGCVEALRTLASVNAGPPGEDERTNPLIEPP